MIRPKEKVIFSKVFRHVTFSKNFALFNNLIRDLERDFLENLPQQKGIFKENGL